MAGNQVVYEIKVDGTSQALGEFAKIESALSGTAKKFSGLSVGDAFKGGEFSKYAPQVDALKKSIDSVGDSGKRAASSLAGGFSGAFKQIAGDIDILAGPSAANLARGFSDAFGLFESVASKGVIGPIAAISVALGGVKVLTDQWEKEIRDVEDAAQKATTAAANQIKSMAELAKKSSEVTREVTTVETVNRRQREINERNRLSAMVEAEIQAGDQMLNKRLMSEEDYDRELNALWEKRMRLNKFNIDTQIMQDQLRTDHNKMLTKEANEADAERAKEARDRLERMDKEWSVTLEELNKPFVDAQSQKAEQTRDIIVGLMGEISDEATKQQVDFKSWMASANIADIGIDDTPEEKANKLKKSQEAANKERDNMFAMNAMLSDRSEEELKLKKAIDDRASAQQKANSETLRGAVVNQAYGFSMTIVNAMMQPFIATLSQYGRLNRENTEEIIGSVDDIKAAFVAQVQAALWALATQSASKSVFEGAEAVKEFALAAGSAAVQDSQGASLHTMSGLTHVAAAGAYALLGGVSAGGSIAVSQMRGEGGLVGLTKEEREQRDSQRRAREGVDGSLGGPTARGGKTGKSSVQVVNNFVYQAGAIDARSREAAASTVATGLKTARRDAFMRKRME